MIVVAQILGMLAAFVMGWYLCRETYKPQVEELKDWALRLIEDYTEMADTALHMKKERNYEVDVAHEAQREAPKLPEITGELGVFIDRIEHPEVREISIAQSRKALMGGMDSMEVLAALRVGDDPLWAKSIGD